MPVINAVPPLWMCAVSPGPGTPGVYMHLSDAGSHALCSQFSGTDQSPVPATHL